MRAEGPEPGADRVVPGHADGTRVVLATGTRSPVRGAPLSVSPVLASVFHLQGPPSGENVPDTYGRTGNPTWRDYERVVGELEGGVALVFGSGMAAIAAVLFACTAPGDVVVVPSDGYYGTRDLATEYLADRGVTVRTVPTTGPYDDGVLDGAALVLLETPSNPGLDVCDLRAVSALAHAAGALVAVDNTTATPLGQRALDLGADLVVASDTKAMTGHSDLLLGHVAGRDADLLAAITRWRTLTGAVPGPVETWLALRSVGTLELRLSRQEANARALVAALSSRPEVSALRWPGLPTDPAHRVAAGQMTRFGGVFSCVLPSAEYAEQLIDNSELLIAATSFGGLHTTIDRRAQWGGDDVPPGFVRVSAGCEDAADLIADVIGAMDRLIALGGRRHMS